ncbi:hypothetical protein EYF80_037252 [Liparis tanakae]|uniref:Uncharacterized protein n=1 Tax=Liparis tanakae TaxID=230148 RepID=A0A4Z2GHD0_9TELE|nr:hypothetical protein EYF80_037252 [Liparis tanakae]
MSLTYWKAVRGLIREERGGRRIKAPDVYRRIYLLEVSRASKCMRISKRGIDDDEYADNDHKAGACSVELPAQRAGEHMKHRAGRVGSGEPCSGIEEPSADWRRHALLTGSYMEEAQQETYATRGPAPGNSGKASNEDGVSQDRPSSLPESQTCQSRKCQKEEGEERAIGWDGNGRRKEVLRRLQSPKACTPPCRLREEGEERGMDEGEGKCDVQGG